MENKKIPCTVEVLTKNSALTLELCLESVKNFAEIIILDGNSTDSTLEIARRFGARIYKQYESGKPNLTISDFSEVRNKGLKLATHDWFMFIDSDEYLSKGAIEEIRNITVHPNPVARAFWQPRKYVLSGKIIDCATTYPNQQVRLFQRSAVDGFIKPVHEKIKVKPGLAIGTLKNFEYVPVENLKELRSRWERYMMQELEVVKGVSRGKLLHYAFRHLGLFAFYSFRYIRNILVCRGKKMPISYEWMRHSYSLRIIGRLARQILGREFDE